MQYSYEGYCRPPKAFFSVVGGIVIKPRAYEFYSVATYLRPLATLVGGTPLTQNPPIIRLMTMARIGLLLFDGDSFNKRYLPSAHAQALSLGQYLDKEIMKIDGSPWDATLEEGKVGAIQKMLEKFQHLLQDEIQKAPLFCCEEESIGNLSVDKLLTGAHNGYPVDIQKHLPPECQFEIDESGRCLVYERPTASGFHILRAVELAIITYLSAIPGFTMPPINRQNWGEYISQLKTHKASKGTIDHLQNLKDNHRNPLMHPQDTLTMPLAVSLFGVCQGTIETIISDGVARGTLK